MFIGDLQDGIYRFLTESNPNVKRIHISHNDLDGYGCTALVKVALSVLDVDNSPSPITYIHVDRPSDIDKVILECVETMLCQGFNKDCDKIRFLITDIGRLRPDVFVKIRNELGVDCNYCYIDHHPDDASIGSNVYKDLSSDPGHSDGEYFEYRLVNTSDCATFMLNDIVFRRIVRSVITHDRSECLSDRHFMNTAGSFRPNIMVYRSAEINRKIAMTHVVSTFANAVNSYDLGQWGAWNCPFDEVAADVKLQLIFSYFFEKGIDFSDEIYEIIMHMDDEVYEQMYDKWREIARMQHEKLLKNLKKCTDNLSKCEDIKVPICEDIIMNLGVNVYKYTIHGPEDELGGMFSLISKELLTSSHIDMLVLVDYRNRTVGLRSKDGGVNCTRVATANGGGGHMRAAGFPF